MDSTNESKPMDGTAREACARLMERCGDPVYKFCRSLTWNRQDADDLFQDTFLEAFHRREKLCQEVNPTGLMLAIASNLWRSRKRRFARRRRLAPEAPLDDTVSGDGDPAEAYLSLEETRLVREAVAALPDRLRIPVTLYYELDMGVLEIADALKLPQGTVKSRLFKARKRIGKELEAAHYAR